MPDEARRDYAVELGSARLAPELDEALVGASPGEEKSVELPVSENETGAVAVTLKQVHERVLPPLDDELARKVSEFDSLDDLRSNLETTLREQLEAELEAQFRAEAVDRLVEAAHVDASGPLVESRTRELLNGLVRSVERRGIAIEEYLSLTGRTPEQLIEALRAEARQSVARELVLEAVADKEQITVGEEEVDALVREQSTEGDDVEEELVQLRETGNYERLRDDLRLRAALDRIASGVKRIPLEPAESR